MIEPLNSSNHIQKLRYQPIQTEGECILLSVTPIAKSKSLYILYLILSILLLGIPIVFVYWYPQLKMFFYFSQCRLKSCSHFYIVNYDGNITIVQRQQQSKQQKDFSIKRQSYKNGMQNIQEQQYGHEQMQIFFVNRYMKYLVTNGLVKASLFNYKDYIKHFVHKNYSLKDKKSLKYHFGTKIQGYDHQKVQELRKRYGIGTMKIQRPTIGILFLREFVRPLYFFILFSLILWLYENYWMYCSIIFLTAAVGIIVNLYQTYHLNNKIHTMAYYDRPVNVLRASKVLRISSIEIVPGDIVFFKQQMKLPFDGVIIEGSCLINECALTGESAPIIKKAEQLQNLKMGKFNEKASQVYQGTTLIQVNNHNRMQIFQDFRQQYGIPVIVTRTNFVTMKGQLIRIISFPQQSLNIFYQQSSYFIIFLFLFAVLSYSIQIIKFYDTIDNEDMIVKFLDLITVTVPPGLPVSMTFGIIFAVSKMEKKNIYCVSPSKVIAGGLVDFLCFDKTGTLTEDYMNFQCLVPCKNLEFTQSIQNKNIIKNEGLITGHIIENIYKQSPGIIHALSNMATNHSIVQIQNTKENVGDPMELKLFQFGEYQVVNKKFKKFSLNQKNQGIFSFESKWGHYGEVYRRFDFNSQLQRMSTVAKTVWPKSQQKQQSFYLYTKGSPEIMLTIFDPSTIPENFIQTLRNYTSQGYRVLAVGHKKIQDIHLDRQQLETDLVFDGFEVFQNSLKPQTKNSIQQLQKASLPCVMITGDNPLTGSSIAYKCGIAHKKKKMYIFDFDQKKNKIICDNFKYEPNEEQRVIEEQLLQEEKMPDIQRKILDQGKTMNPQGGSRIYGQDQLITDPIDQDIRQLLQNLGPNNGQVCLTGNAFNHFFENLNFSQKFTYNRQILLENTTVFARTKPNDKARIVMAYQNLDKRVSMCGDGANDCGALKQADIGLSLSPAQASISAPFTSKQTNISSMVELIKQCRAGLVTNFSLFDIMCMYSFIQYTSDMILQYIYTFPANYQLVYWDIFGNFILFMTFGYTKTGKNLTKDKPSYILLSFTNLLQLITMLIIQALGQMFMIYSLGHIFRDNINYSQKGGAQNNYQRYKDNGDSYALDTPQTNIIFLFSSFMYIFTFIAFSFSKPWRYQFYTNKPFLICFILVFLLSSLLILVPETRLPIFQCTYLQHDSQVNLFIFLSALGFGLFILVMQKCILQPLSKKLRRRYPHSKLI